LDRLGPAKEIAQIAATIGREFDFELLREASGLPESAVRAGLTNLVRSGLIVPKEGADDSAFSFKHALLQQAARRTILRERCQQLHALIGRTMEMRDPKASSAYPELLAQHFADAGLFDHAADYWLLAGLKAAKTWAKVEAAQMFGKGIEAARMVPDSPERSRRLLRLELERGDVLYAAFGYVTGQGSAAYHRAIQLSEELGDPEASIRALDGLFGTHFNSGQFSESIGASDRLIDIGESRNNLKALVLGLQFKGMSLFCQGQLTSARLYLERALSHRARADEVGSDFPSMTMIYLSWTMHILGHDEAALGYFREAEAIVRRQSAYRLAACLGNGCILFAFREESATIMRLAEELLPLARENGLNLWTKMADFFRGCAVANIDGSVAGTAVMQETIQVLEDQEVDK
jgi:tetratricopeptide (TPR) repeat protein